MMRRIIFSLLVAAFALFGAQQAFAQSLSVASDISVTVTPEHPGPNETVTITLSSFSTDLKLAFISWTVDGRAAVSSVGADHVTVTTKAIGVSTKVVATISPVGEAPIIKNIAISPTTVDMLWEATDSIVPPFYRGKAMPTSESSVKFVAIPQVRATNGALLAPSNFVYEWKENYTADSSKGGYGKNGFSSVMDYLNPVKHIGVKLSSRDGTVVASKDLNLSPTSPKIVWYASSPLYGPLYDRALSGSYTVEGSDTSLIAEPYFFSPGDPASKALKYTWKLNGEKIETPIPQYSLFLHRESDVTGTATVSVAVANLSKIYQDMTANLTLLLQ